MVKKRRPRRGYTANTAAPRSSYAIKPGSPVGGRGRAKYPIDTLGRARNALSRVGASGSPAEKRLVYRAIRTKYPALAKRSSIPALAKATRSRTSRKRKPRPRRRRTR